MKKLQRVATLLLVTLAVGCAQLGVSAPDTFNQKAAVAYATVTQIRETATTLTVARRLTGEEATKFLQSTDVARAGIDVAVKTYATDKTQAEKNLDLIRASLAALSTYLASK